MNKYLYLTIALLVLPASVIAVAACDSGDDDDDTDDDDDDTFDDDTGDDDDMDDDTGDDDDDTGDDDDDDDTGDDDDDDDDDTAYSHTITIDGVNDFTADENFSTTTMGFTGYITWDDTYAFFGMDGADIGGCSSTKWLLIYLSGTPGTTTGVQYNNQQPALPFSAKYHVRWKADNTYTNAMEYSVSNWVDAGWNFTGDVFQSGTFLEMRVPFADIGSPAAFSVVMCMINEAGGSEWTYAGVPDTVFSDGVDPDYGHYYQFDLTGSTPPNQYVPVALY